MRFPLQARATGVRSVASIHDLRIERAAEGRDDPGPRGAGRSRLTLWAALIGILLAAAAAAVVFVFRGETPATAAAQEPEPETVAANAAADGAQTGQTILQASGNLVADRSAILTSRATGLVTAVMVAEGDRIERGQLIAEIDDRAMLAQIEQARASVQEAEARTERAMALSERAASRLDRATRLQEGNAISAEAYEDARFDLDVARTDIELERERLEGARAALRLLELQHGYTQVTSPFAGTLTSLDIKVGEVVHADLAAGRSGIATLVDFDSLSAEVRVGERSLLDINKGNLVEIRPDALPDVALRGCVSQIIPTIDAARASVRIKIALLERDPRLIPNMAIQVAFRPEMIADCGADRRPAAD